MTKSELYAKLAIKKPKVVIRYVANMLKVVLLKKKILQTAIIAIENRCNLSCEKCFANIYVNKRKKKFNIEEIKNIAEQCKSQGAIVLDLSGGEPTLNKDLSKIISTVNNNDVLVSITTNGSFLTYNMAKKLKESGLDLIQVSIDSSIPKKHDESRGKKGSFEKAIKAIENSKKVGLDIIIKSVATKEVLQTGDAYGLLRIADKYGAHLSLIVPANVGGWKDKDMSLDGNDNAILEKICKNPNVSRDLDTTYFEKGCSAGSEKIFITPQGEVFPCPFIQISFGNINNSNLDNIMKKMTRISKFNKIHKSCIACEDKEFIDNYLIPISNKEGFIKAEEHPAVKKII